MYKSDKCLNILQHNVDSVVNCVEKNISTAYENNFWVRSCGILIILFFRDREGSQLFFHTPFL